MLNLNGKNILVTGGCGFIGSNFLEFLFKYYKNLTILNIDKLGIGHRVFPTEVVTETNSYVEFNEDLCWLLPKEDLFWCGMLFKTKFDYIFHFAAESHVDRSINTPDKFVYNNVNGMIRLLEFVRIAQPQAKVINISTDEVYGHLMENDPPFTETSNFNPRSPYSASKASADLLAKSYVSTYGLDIITTHCCNNFGPHQADEKFIPTIIKSLFSKKQIPLYGTGKNIREWIYVDDHNKSLLEIAEFGERGLSYNIGSGIEKTNLEMIQDISTILNMSPKIKYVEDRKGHDFRYAIESMRYKRNFQLQNHMDALEKTVEFYAGKIGQNTK